MYNISDGVAAEVDKFVICFNEKETRRSLDKQATERVIQLIRRSLRTSDIVPHLFSGIYKTICDQLITNKA